MWRRRRTHVRPPGEFGRHLWAGQLELVLVGRSHRGEGALAGRRDRCHRHGPVDNAVAMRSRWRKDVGPIKSVTATACFVNVNVLVTSETAPASRSIASYPLNSSRFPNHIKFPPNSALLR